jgi:hypothetical protein
MSLHHHCEYNCGGTGCNAPLRYVTYTATEGCQHDDYWVVSVQFWIFTKRVKVCVDCGHVDAFKSGR